jgi:hypothetical protein
MTHAISNSGPRCSTRFVILRQGFEIPQISTSVAKVHVGLEHEVPVSARPLLASR